MAEQVNILSKEFWMPDSSSKVCSNCEKPFTSIRRRHHCRYCGFLFCSNCTRSKRILPDGVQILRACEPCINALSAPKRPSRTYLVRQMTIHKVQESSKAIGPNEQEQETLQEKIKEAEAEIKEQNVIELLTEMNSSSGSEYEQYTNDFMELRTEAVLRELELGLDKKEMIIDLVKKVVETICPSTQYREDLMDLSSYVKFVMIESTDTSLTEFVNGVIIKQNDARRLETIDNPKILMLQGMDHEQSAENNIDAEEKQAGLDSNYSRMVIKRIQGIRPNIILLEKSLNKSTVQELEKLGITILMNLKPKQLDLVARALGGKVLESVYHSSFLDLYLGNCSEFSSKKLENDRYVYFSGLKYTSVGGSIILSDTSKKILKSTKIALKRLLSEYRHIKLETQFYIQANIKPFSNIFLSMHNMNANFIYLSISRNQICRKSNLSGFLFYGIDDQPLGEFLIAISQEIDEYCDYGCGNYLKSHTYYFVKSNGRVKISFTKVINSGVGDEIKMFISCAHCKNDEENPINISKSIWELSFHKFISNFLLNQYITQKKCSHDLYKSHKFIFLLASAKISMIWEENHMYELVPQNYNCETPADYDREAVETLFNMFKENGLLILNFLHNFVYELIEKINKEKQEDQEEWNEMHKKSIAVKDELEQIKGKLENTELDSFNNYFAIEKAKRSLFLKCCNIKVQSEVTSNNVLRLKLGFKTVVAESISTRGPRSDSDPTIPMKPFALPLTVAPFSEKDKFLDHPAFAFLKHGNMTLPLGMKKQCISVEEKDRMSIIAYSLNSVQYQKNMSAITEDFKEIIENQLYISDHFTFHTSNYEENTRKDDFRRLYGDRISISTTAYFPKQFDAFRKLLYGQNFDLIKSIIKSKLDDESFGPKKFFISHDHRFLLKIITEQEFLMLTQLAPNYFRHMYRHFYRGMHSRLLKIIGLYKVVFNNHYSGWNRIEYLCLMENLRYRMPLNSVVYELRGTSKKDHMNRKGDMTFLNDFDGLPINLSWEEKQILDAGIWNDSIFLSKQNIVDYTLLVVISSDRKVNIALIDYFQQYTLSHAIKNSGIKEELNPPLLPYTYKERFRMQISQSYFLCPDKYN